ncbi:MAG: hypothetical protein ACJ72N_15210 [Labedaea sp.]
MTSVAPHDPNMTLEALVPPGVVDRVAANILGDDKLWVGDQRLRPSGLDRIACAAARVVLSDPTGAVALATPRGTSPLPVLVGLYLVSARVVRRRLGGGMCGSVAISTQRTELRDAVRGLVFDGSQLEDAVRIARLVPEPRPDKRVRAAALSLDRRHRKGLDQQDAYLLFQLPNRAPPVALNVISAMVCDTHAASVGSWETTRERNVAARRRQVWLGELGDDEFEAFCDRHNIALLRCDWPLIAAAARTHGTGASRLASTGATERALQAPTVSYRVVEHEELDEELRELAYRLAEMRKRGRTDAPDAVANASWLASVLTRSACPLAFYDAAVAHYPMSRRAQWLVERVTDASSGAFRNRWKLAFEQHWTGVKGAAKQAMRLLADAEEHPKWWAVQERLAALEDGQRLRILCQTRAEARAMRDALLDSELVDERDFGELVDVASFSRRAPQGPADDTITLLLSPPPPQRAAIYLSGEAGAVEVFCYPFEVGRLRAHLARAVREHAGLPHNAAAIAALRGGAPSTNGHAPARVDVDALVAQLPGYGDRPPVSDDVPTDIKLPDADADFWEYAAELYDTELAGDEPDRGDTEAEADADAGGYSGYAHLVRFQDGPPMYMRDDADCTIVIDDPERPGEHDIITLTPAELERGMRIAVLPGSERGGLLAELMAAWDEGLALVRRRYEGMYRRALDAAIAEHGLDGVGSAVRLTPDAVRAWRDGRAWPGTGPTLRRLLEISGDQEAIRNQALIQDYFSRVRGAHRYIGRVLNDAVGETVLHEHGRDSIRKLEEFVGRDLSDLFDATSVLTVESVSAPEKIAASVCGSFLDRDDPYLKSKGVL